jgi:peptidoglycan/LPS O-acetylase OafA/YrhL
MGVSSRARGAGGEESLNFQFWRDMPRHKKSILMSAARENFSQNNFDLIRLFAATQIMLGHASAYLLRCHAHYLSVDVAGVSISPLRFWADFHGVWIFFVISGFLVSASYERSQSLKTYFVNRGLRIYPALWVCLFVTIGVIFAFQVPFRWGEFWPWVAAQATVVQFYNPPFLRNFAEEVFAGKAVINGSLWTIPIELQFYLVFPLICLAYGKIAKGKIGNRTAFFLFAVFFLFALLPLNFSETVSFFGKDPAKLLAGTFLPHFYLFLFGWLLRKNMEKLGCFFNGKALYWLAAYFAFLSLREFCGFHFFGETQFSRLFLGCVAVSFAYTLPWFAGRITRGNDISYGVYIYHMLFINVMIELGLFGMGKYWCALLLCALVYAAAFLSWRFVEKPCLALKKLTIKKIQ